MVNRILLKTPKINSARNFYFSVDELPPKLKFIFAVKNFKEVAKW